MELKYRLFLEALQAYFKHEKVNWDFEISMDLWKEIFALAEEHKVQPLIFEAVYDCPAIAGMDSMFLHTMKRRGLNIMMLQVRKTAEFLKLYEQLGREELRPLVVKGIICRSLYPNPDLRVSSDEDLLVEPSSFGAMVESLKNYGLRMTNAPEDPQEADEIGFLSADAVNYIELHSALFSRDSKSYGELNAYFERGFETCVPVTVQGTVVYTLEPQLHLFYLICHSLKHFLHSGFGIRQVCDIVLFANAYGAQIDWEQLLGWCREIHGDLFAAALFKIGKQYIGFDEAASGYPKQWQELDIDETNLLLELLESGIYGGSSMSRRHSSHLTLEAAAAEKTGRKSGGLRASLFPSAKQMEGQYSYLKKQPYLLPVAWGDRLLKYCRETVKEQDNSALEAVKIGNRRVALLKQYGILEK